MKKRWRIFTALCFMFTALIFLAGVPGASADSLQDQINALKGEVEKLEGQQLELKKQATEAAAALPNFSYRGGNGILMEAADKSWSLRFSNRFHYWMLFREGEAKTRVGMGELFARRIRPTFNYCVNNCLYETEVSFDLDSTDAVSLQRATSFVHLGQINPWLPSLVFGIDAPTAWARRRSSSSGAQLDYDMLTRSIFNTGSQGWAYGLLWEDKPLSSIGIPGKIEWLNFMVGAGPGAASDGGFRNSDRKDYVISMAVTPFSDLKSKWLRGLELSMGYWWCNFDSNSLASNGCSESRIRETDGPNRADIWRHSIVSANNTQNTLQQYSLRYRVGPYQLLATYGHMNFGNTVVEHDNFYIAHELYVWSPKGFLTGSSSTPGSVLIGTHFERSDGKCREGTSNRCATGANATGNNHAMLASASLYYVIQRGLNVGVHWNHYDAKKLSANAKNELDQNGTSWDNVFVNFRWEY